MKKETKKYRYLMVYMDVVKTIEDLHSVLLYSYLVNKLKMLIRSKSVANERSWFYYEKDYLEQDSGFSDYRIKKVTKELIELKLLEKKSVVRDTGGFQTQYRLNSKVAVDLFGFNPVNPVRELEDDFGDY